MAKGVTVSVKGLKQLEKNLAQFDKLATRRTAGRNALKSAGWLFANKARRLAPDDPNTTTQDLKSEIGVGTRLTSRQRKANRQNIKRGQGSDLEVFAGASEHISAYAHLQEFGTRNHSAQPYMRPAWDSQKTKMLVTVRMQLKLNISKAANRIAKRKA